MVSAFRADSIRNPTEALQDLYRSHSQLEIPNHFPRLVSEHFANIFEPTRAFQEIPTLDARNPPNSYPDRSLVRFRAMVQDTSPSSEMYLCRFKNGSCGGWGIGDALDSDEDGAAGVDYSSLRECTSLWAVSVPGESRWFSEELDGPEDRQVRPFTSSGSPETGEKSRSHKFPGNDVPQIGVQVKLYDTDVSDTFKSTDIVTFVGILTTEALSSEFDRPMDVPTLHVLFSRSHPQPAPHSSLSEAPSEDQVRDRECQHNDIPEVARIREELVTWIADEALGGDREAAEWVLLACISRVQSRTPPLLPLSLTIARFPPPIPTAPSPATSSSPTPTGPVPALSALLELLVPLTRTLSLSLDTLNRESFCPESKEEDLHAGLLQLPQKTVLLVNEAGISSGKVEERGIMNIRALQDVISAQTLAYDFPFSRFSFPTDISCIILSEGSKSAFFKTDVCLPLKPSKTHTDAISELYKSRQDIKLPSADRLAAFRDLIRGAWEAKVQVDEVLSEYIQQDFVKDRQKDKSITSDDLIRRMSVAKLYALSLREPSLTIDLWERAKAFDARRLASSL